MTTTFESLAKVSHLQPPERLAAFIDLAEATSHEPFLTAIPCFGLGPEGLKLSSIFLMSKSYLAELHLGDPGITVDFVRLETVRNYTVTLNETTIVVNTRELRYQTATVMLRHVATDSFFSSLSYVGTDRDGWLTQVRQALPLERILRG